MLSTSAQQVKNGSFEQWVPDTTGVYPRPEGWEYDHAIRTYRAAMPVHAYIPGNSGDFSVLVWNAEDTLSRTKLRGHLWQRVPLNFQRPQALRLFITYMLTEADTAAVQIVLLRNGRTISTTSRYFTGDLPHGEMIYIPVDQSSAVLPDTAVIHFYASVLQQLYTCEWISPMLGMGDCHSISIDDVELLYAAPEFNCTIYPNPSGGSGTLLITAPQQSEVHAALFDIRGRRLADETWTTQSADEEHAFDLTGLNSGLYFYRLSCGDITLTRKLVLSVQ